MRITDLLARESIALSGAPENKDAAIRGMADLMEKSGRLHDRQAYIDGLFAREEESTTAVGEEIAIPHYKGPAVSRPGLAAMVVPDGVEFDSVDGQPVTLIFAIAAPDTRENVHLDVLSKLSVLLMDEAFTESLRNAKTPEEFLKIIDRTESSRDDEEREKAEPPAQAAPQARQVRLLGVTGCPTGIAHTFMAAEGLEKAAARAGYAMKVETRGSGGAKNVLTPEEIAAADCIIVAADTQVPMERFDGKPVLECQVSDGISKADQLVKRAAAGTVPVYRGKGGGEASAPASGGGVWHQVYKHLMNGVSHMLPFVVGGGILIAIAFLIDGLAVDLSAVSEEVRAQFGTITPAAALFKGIGGVAFSFMLPVLAGFIAVSIADRPGLAVGVVGGAIAANGTSGFLGALAAGFIAGYLVVFLRKIFDRLPKGMDGLKPVLLYPLLGVLGIGLIMTFLIEPPIGALNTAMNNGLASMHGASKILLGLLLGGMMSVDFGGPVNKAAYVFGTASIAAGNYDIMAAVMIGGMVPPCAIALATLLFKQKFTAEERKAGPTNFIMGLSFITEGAIPFAASDPLRVIPACIVGSAIAGALSMAFNCALMAPHGGIFVFPVVDHAMFYLLALALGTVISAVLLGLLKKTAAKS